MCIFKGSVEREMDIFLLNLREEKMLTNNTI